MNNCVFERFWIRDFKISLYRKRFRKRFPHFSILLQHLAFSLEVANCSLDRVLGKHGAVQLYWRQIQMIGDFGIGHGRRLGECLSLDPLRRHRGRRNRGSAPKCLEPGIHNAVAFYANLQLHNVTTCRRADNACTNRGVHLVE